MDELPPEFHESLFKVGVRTFLVAMLVLFLLLGVVITTGFTGVAPFVYSLF